MNKTLGEHSEVYWKHKIMELIDCINLLVTSPERINKEIIDEQLINKGIDYHISLYYHFSKRHQNIINSFKLEREV